MKNYINTILYSILIIVTISCSNDDGDTNGGLPGDGLKIQEYSPFLLNPTLVDFRTVNDGTIGDIVYLTNTNKESATKVVTMEYDNNRIVKRKGKLKTISSSLIGLPFSFFEDRIEQTIAYEGNTITIKSTGIDERTPFADTPEEEKMFLEEILRYNPAPPFDSKITVDNQGTILKRESYILSQNSRSYNKSTEEYEYTGDKLTKSTATILYTRGMQEKISEYVYDANGNITEVNSKTRGVLDGRLSGFTYQKETYTPIDSRPNPWKSLYIFNDIFFSSLSRNIVVKNGEFNISFDLSPCIEDNTDTIPIPCVDNNIANSFDFELPPSTDLFSDQFNETLELVLSSIDPDIFIREQNLGYNRNLTEGVDYYTFDITPLNPTSFSLGVRGGVKVSAN